MTDRVWVHNRMASDPTVSAAVVDRIFQSTSLYAAPHDKPFIMYRQTSDVLVMRGSGREEIRQRGYMLFVHDIPGSYKRIDLLLAVIKPLFSETRDPAAGIVYSEWVDASDDQRDEDMGTIMKFARISVKYKV